MGGMAALAIIMLVWSGSRGGVLMALVGVALLFRVKLGRLAVGGAVVAIFVMLAVTWIFPEHNVLSEHLLSTEDTRTGVWLRLGGTFWKARWRADSGEPAFPRRGCLAIGESSYLSIAARFGLVCLIPFGLSMFYIARASLRLERSRREFADVLLPDLVNAGIVQILLGAVFEGYLLGCSLRRS
jgi:hypothetical protein